MDGESGEEKDDWGKHKEVKLVHEVKMEVYSRDEASEAYWKERSVIFREDAGDLGIDPFQSNGMVTILDFC